MGGANSSDDEQANKNAKNEESSGWCAQNRQNRAG